MNYGGMIEVPLLLIRYFEFFNFNASKKFLTRCATLIKEKKTSKINLLLIVSILSSSSIFKIPTKSVQGKLKIVDNTIFQT